MRVAVIGAGITGVTTTAELVRDGHEVEVFERRGAAAEEGSFAPSGLQAPGLVEPLAGPPRAANWIAPWLTPQDGLRLRWPLPPGGWSWLRHGRRAARAATSPALRGTLLALAQYSRARLRALRTALELGYDRSEGVLWLLRTENERQRVQPRLQRLSDAGVPFGQLDPDQARKIEPALPADTPLAGAVLFPDDEAGNSREFTQLLRQAAQQAGARFHFQATVQRITTSPRPSLQLQGEPQPRDFDAIVVCAGVGSAALLAPLGLKLPLAPVHVHTLSAALREHLNAPRSAVFDEQHQVGICRLGERIRVGGSTELGGDPVTRRADAFAPLYRVLHDWFPGAAHHNTTVQEWKGTVATLPDGPPLVGPAGPAGLWLNLGHGAHSWSLACGSARVLADLVLGHAPEVDIRGLAVERLRRTA